MVINIDIVKSSRRGKNMILLYIERMVELKLFHLDKLAHLIIHSIKPRAARMPIFLAIRLMKTGHLKGMKLLVSIAGGFSGTYPP